MNPINKEKNAWIILNNACRVSKKLLWLRDTDPSLKLALDLRDSLKDALETVARFPDALSALQKKLYKIYNRAIREKKPLVGIGAEITSTRLGDRTLKEGLPAALDWARQNKKQFQHDARKTCSKSFDWEDLFRLASQFIDLLDWGEFVLENARGQAACTVLECVELVEAVRSKKENKIQEELGDVFYNLMACCLSLKIEAKHLGLK